MMKVYAEFFEESNGKKYRKKTLLCFGNSKRLIGSAVMINPGSAKPIGEADCDFIKSFYGENHRKTIYLGNWKEFSPDPTMKQLEKIFNGSYINKKTKLNGVIQIFNCFYYRDQNIEEAIKNFDSESKYNFNEYDYLLEKPVYFGWGGAGKHGELKSIASEIFSKYNLENTPIYHAEFMDNCFYHPGYVNRSYKTNENTKELLLKFFNLLKME